MNQDHRSFLQPQTGEAATKNITETEVFPPMPGSSLIRFAKHIDPNTSPATKQSIVPEPKIPVPVQITTDLRPRPSPTPVSQSPSESD